MLTRRGFLTSVSLATAAVAVAGCSSGAVPSGSPTAATESAEAVFPVTIDHKFGSTTLTAAPVRVVSVGLVEQDALLALGVVPVAVTHWFGEAEGRIFPWAAEKLGGNPLPKVLRTDNGLEVEQIAALKPDLIIGQYAGITEQEYALLTKLAPTVVQPKEYVDYGVPWDQATITVAKAIGQPAAGQALVDSVKARIAEDAAAHPEFAGRKAAVVTPYEGIWVYGPQDPRSRILNELGFVYPEVLKSPDATAFGWSISPEKMADLDELDVVVWLDLDDADAAFTTLWEKTTAARQGRYFSIGEANGSYYVGHSMITPLSIPYVLDRYVPQLAAALDADPATKPESPTD